MFTITSQTFPEKQQTSSDLKSVRQEIFTNILANYNVFVSVVSLYLNFFFFFLPPFCNFLKTFKDIFCNNFRSFSEIFLTVQLLFCYFWYLFNTIFDSKINSFPNLNFVSDQICTEITIFQLFSVIFSASHCFFLTRNTHYLYFSRNTHYFYFSRNTNYFYFSRNTHYFLFLKEHSLFSFLLEH